MSRWWLGWSFRILRTFRRQMTQLPPRSWLQHRHISWLTCRRSDTLQVGRQICCRCRLSLSSIQQPFQLSHPRLHHLCIQTYQRAAVAAGRSCILSFRSSRCTFRAPGFVGRVPGQRKDHLNFLTALCAVFATCAADCRWLSLLARLSSCSCSHACARACVSVHMWGNLV